jgi:hypothetical protein
MQVTDKECEHYAPECVRLAGQISDLEVREQLLGMAREWMALAMHEPKPPAPKWVPAP